MPYIDGFIAAVPNANKQKFIDHANAGDAVFVDHGATRVVECWGDDVPHGTLTDFHRAVQARDDEIVLFSWIEWPDKTRRDAGMAAAMKDPRLSPDNNPRPFDGKRLIYGGFAPLLELGDASTPMSYVDGFVLVAATADKQAFTDYARTFDTIFMELGATRIIEAWEDDVPDGTLTDFRKAVQAGEGESVAFSWVEWPDKATRDAGMAKMAQDPRMDPGNPDNPPMPFDGKRMIFGGFSPVLHLRAAE